MNTAPLWIAAGLFLATVKSIDCILCNTSLLERVWP